MSLNKKDECSVYNGWVTEDGDVLELHSLMVLLQLVLLIVYLYIHVSCQVWCCVVFSYIKPVSVCNKSNDRLPYFPV